MILTLSHKRSFVECSRWTFFVECSRWTFGPSGLYIQCVYVKCGKYMYGWISQTGSQICQMASFIISWRWCIIEQKFEKKRSQIHQTGSWILKLLYMCVVEQNIWKTGPPGICNEHIYTTYGPKCQSGSFGSLSYSAYMRQKPVPRNCRESFSPTKNLNIILELWFTR